MKVFVESARKTASLRAAVLSFLQELNEKKMVTGWDGLPVDKAADYITGYIIGAMAAR